jgi:hypothetical protein
VKYGQIKIHGCCQLVEINLSYCLQETSARVLEYIITISEIVAVKTDQTRMQKYNKVFAGGNKYFNLLDTKYFISLNVGDFLKLYPF